MTLAGLVAQATPIRLVRDLGQPFSEPIWPTGIAVHALTPADAPQVHALMELCYENGFGRVPDYETWWATTRHDDEYDPSLCLVAAADDERPVGFALVWNSAFVKDLVVRPDWQGRGLGSALLAEVFSRLKARGFDSVALKVKAENEKARRLYARMGFAG